MQRKVRHWTLGVSPLMRIGTYVFNDEFPDEVPTSLFFAAADYCRTRIEDFKRRKNNHKNRSSIRYYTWWLEKIEYQIQCLAPDQI